VLHARPARCQPQPDADIQAAIALNPMVGDQAKHFGIAAAGTPSPAGLSIAEK
jgi:hypothetical protein